VGANIGTWSIEMAKRFNKVYSFEIYPPTFECLKKNIEERNLENKNIALVDDRIPIRIPKKPSCVEAGSST